MGRQALHMAVCLPPLHLASVSHHINMHTMRGRDFCDKEMTKLNIIAGGMEPDVLVW